MIDKIYFEYFNAAVDIYLHLKTWTVAVLYGRKPLCFPAVGLRINRSYCFDLWKWHINLSSDRVYFRVYFRYPCAVYHIVLLFKWSVCSLSFTLVDLISLHQLLQKSIAWYIEHALFCIPFLPVLVNSFQCKCDLNMSNIIAVLA